MIIRTNAAGSVCLLYCICSILHALAMIKPIPCHIFSNSPGRVTSAPVCHRSHKSIPQDPSSHQHFYLLLLLQLTLTCKCGNTSSRGSTKQIILDFTPSFSCSRDRAETQLRSGIWNVQVLPAPSCLSNLTEVTIDLAGSEVGLAGSTSPREAVGWSRRCWWDLLTSLQCVLCHRPAEGSQPSSVVRCHLDFILGPDDQVFHQAVVDFCTGDVLVLVLSWEAGQAIPATWGEELAA